jgi:hypothetical protein
MRTALLSRDLFAKVAPFTFINKPIFHCVVLYKSPIVFLNLHFLFIDATKFSTHR